MLQRLGPATIRRGIATYSQAGAQFGYGLLWTVFLTSPFMIAIQLVSARIGRVTGKGLAANVMQSPALGVLSLVVTARRRQHLQHRRRHRRDGGGALARDRRPQLTSTR